MQKKVLFVLICLLFISTMTACVGQAPVTTQPVTSPGLLPDRILPYQPDELHVADEPVQATAVSPVSTTPAGISLPATPAVAGDPPPAAAANPDSLWTWQNPPPSDYDLQAIWGSSSSDVFAAGDAGTILHYNGQTWNTMTSGASSDLKGIWGISSTDVFAVGYSGTILHYNGQAWNNEFKDNTCQLNSVWGTSSSDVFAVGYMSVAKKVEGLILHFDGKNWTKMDIYADNQMTDIWGFSSTDVFAVGFSGAILHYNGKTWSRMCSNTTKSLQDVWGSSPSDIYAIGAGQNDDDHGVSLHFNGKNWLGIGTKPAFAVWGTSSTDVFILETDNSPSRYIRHYDGKNWRKIFNNRESNLCSIWGSSSSDVMAVGQKGGILHYSGYPASTLADSPAPAPASPPSSTEPTLPAPLNITLLSQAWDQITQKYVDPAKIDMAALNKGALESMFRAAGLANSLSGLALSSTGLDIKLLTLAWDTIGRNSQQPMDVDKLHQAALDGMVKALHDPYSHYFSQIDYYRMKQLQTQSNNFGTGMYMILNRRHELVIVRVIKDSPADKAGFKDEDLVLAINGKFIKDLDEKIIQLLVGDSTATSFKYTVYRPNQGTVLDLDLSFGRIKPETVDFRIIQNIAYIRISSFFEHTGDEFQTALDSLDLSRYKGLVLDLRNNTGGYLITTLDVGSHFMDHGLFYILKDNKGYLNRVDMSGYVLYKTSRNSSGNDQQSPLQNFMGLNRALVNLPLVVLVNEYSASASEVLAGALQDRDLAIIAGTQTFGKGSSDIYIELMDGSAIYLTIARNLTPDQHEIEGKGITPDYLLQQTGDEAVQWAVKYLQMH
jgi:C-terminal processing protease CtpA/Prc/photosystem II stability/assembly factor-like uncharacterized protein